MHETLRNKNKPTIEKRQSWDSQPEGQQHVAQEQEPALSREVGYACHSGDITPDATAPKSCLP